MTELSVAKMELWSMLY